MPAQAVVAGHIALDILPDMSSLSPAQVIEQGKVHEIGRISYSTGGAVSNTGLALHRLGVDVALQAAVGDDWVGRAIIDYTRGFHPNLGDHIRVFPRAASPYTIVIEPQNHDRTLLTHTGVYNDYDSDSIDYDMLDGCRLFHLGYPTLLPRFFADDGADFLRTLRRAKARVPALSIDMSLPPPDSPEPFMVDRKQALAAKDAIETPDQARARRGNGAHTPEHYVPTPPLGIADADKGIVGSPYAEKV